MIVARDFSYTHTHTHTHKPIKIVKIRNGLNSGTNFTMLKTYTRARSLVIAQTLIHIRARTRTPKEKKEKMKLNAMCLWKRKQHRSFEVIVLECVYVWRRICMALNLCLFLFSFENLSDQWRRMVPCVPITSWYDTITFKSFSFFVSRFYVERFKAYPTTVTLNKQR